MLEKSNYSDTGSVTQTNSEKTPAFVPAKSIDKDELQLTISASRNDIPRVRPKTASVFGSTLVFKGELSADEELLIQGTVEGTIAHHKKNVTVGEHGRVKALIHASSVTVQGRVDGDIHGDDYVILAAGAEVNGNIFCPRIRMDDGARFNGTIQMGQSARLSRAEYSAAIRDLGA